MDIIGFAEEVLNSISGLLFFTKDFYAGAILRVISKLLGKFEID